MPREPRRRWIALLALAAFAAIALVVHRAGRLPDGPEPVAWNAAPCAHCHMLVGDPDFAAQLISATGEVLDFDDAGCLLRYLADHHPAIHRLWFHRHGGEGWLSADAVGFVGGAATPMGFGLIAVERGAPGALTLDEARARVAAAGDPP
jgi:copper chaperone NosL